jgi:hypothetical protein
MPPTRQRTFELVPTSLVKSGGPKPPMTSKAAKKAYQKANRGPRISRAEQRRLQQEELDRQKKEWAREQAAAKAKAARMKKAEKENAEKEARKKMGLPEPSKYVRASQPTISRFVRNGGKRKWEEVDNIAEDSEGTACDADTVDKDEPPPKRVAQDNDSDDEFGDFPALSQMDLLEKIAKPITPIKGVSAGQRSPASKANLPPELRDPESSQELPVRKSSNNEYPLEDSQAFADMANTQLLSEAAEAASKSDSIEPPAVLRVQNPSQNNSKPEPKGIVEYKKPPSINSRNISHMSPPSIRPAPRVRKPIPFVPPPRNPRFLLRNSARARPYSDVPAPSTQAFLENSIEDFFPSPSQEVRELLEDNEDPPAKPHIIQAPNPPKLPKNINEDYLFDDLISTQDLILSPQDLQEITTPSRAPLSKPIHGPPKPHLSYPASRVGNPLNDFRPPLPAPPLESKPPNQPKSYPPPPVTREFKTTIAPKPYLQPPPARDLKSLDQPKIQAPSPAPREPKPPAGPKAHLSPAPPREKSRFFEEKEEDLLQAAIHESKMLAAQQEVQNVPLNGSPEKGKRTLQRIGSTATDYGDDEFSGCSQELLALC